MHDSSDTASAGSPISSSNPSAPAPSTTVNSGIPMAFLQTAEPKASEKFTDVAVVSLVPPAPMNAVQAPSGNPTCCREDYDSSATVRLFIPRKYSCR